MTFNNVGNELLKHVYGKTKTLDSNSPQGGLEIFLVGERTDALVSGVPGEGMAALGSGLVQTLPP